MGEGSRRICGLRYSGVTLHPFEGGMEKIVREKMLSVAGYDFGAVISDVGDWKRRE